MPKLIREAKQRFSGVGRALQLANQSSEKSLSHAAKQYFLTNNHESAAFNLEADYRLFLATWKNWRMNKPPIQQSKQKDYIKSAIRMPAALHQELTAAAEQNGHSLNAEMLSRLSSSPLDDIKRQNEELKMMLRQVLGHLRS